MSNGGEYNGDRDGQAEAYQHEQDLKRQKEEEEALEHCSFAGAVANVADYLQKYGDIPKESTLDILFRLARWGEKEHEALDILADEDGVPW